MKKISLTQFEILRRLSMGERIRSSRYRTAGAFPHEGDKVRFLYIYASTMKSLQQRGFIRLTDEDQRRDYGPRHYVITEAGRRVFEEQQDE